MLKTASSEINNTIGRETASLQAAIKQIELLKEDQLNKLDEINQEISSLDIIQSNQISNIQNLKNDIAEQQKELANYDLLYVPEYKYRLKHYKEVVQSPMTQEARQIVQLIHSQQYLGIVVYPHAVKWEPIQRPQHILMEFARQGYLCFFCDHADTFYIREIEDRMFVVSNQDHLLQALQTTHVLVINSYLLQNPWIEQLPHKSLWYDVLDRVDFFSNYDRNMLAKHYQVLHEADIVTYSAKRLSEYVKDREDAIYLPNASRPEDFKHKDIQKLEIPEDLKPILQKNKRVIGYYGAIEEWFDKKLVITMAEDPQIEIVLIGYCGISKDSFPENVHFLGAKPYAQLKDYTAFFDALMIPFIVNSLTNSVSPVKFFEYCSIGKPIITTPIAEVLLYKGPGITFIDHDASVNIDPELWNITSEIENHLKTIAENNQWSKRVELIKKNLESRPSCLNFFANRSYNNHVSVFAATFLDYEGANYYSGGAERYLVDLHEACSELGLKLDIYQYGNFSWYRKYNDIDVYSLGNESLNIREFSFENLKQFNRRFLYSVEEKSVMNFYSAFFQAYPDVAHPSVGISHGVAWDHPGSDFAEGNQFWSFNERFIQSAKLVQKMVSVDTNTANWFQTVSYKTAQNIITIPNYVDHNEFFAIPRKKDTKIRIVYPRRLYEARGLYITLKVVDKILKEYPNTEFHFVGKGFEIDVKEVEKAIERWPGRIFCYHRDPDDMHSVYKEADIVLIPTLYSEGTSLSCLEACATGNTVIATRIGGLTDIIIDHYNGILINPDYKSLEEAIIECLDNPKLRETLGKNAIQVSKVFNKKNWKEKWKTVIKQMLSENNYLHEQSGVSTSSETAELRLGINTRVEEWLPFAVACLKKGQAVFIRGYEELEQIQDSSFARIQWISNDTELYFQPNTIKTFD